MKNTTLALSALFSIAASSASADVVQLPAVYWYNTASAAATTSEGRLVQAAAANSSPNGASQIPTADVGISGPGVYADVRAWTITQAGPYLWSKTTIKLSCGDSDLGCVRNVSASANAGGGYTYGLYVSDVSGSSDQNGFVPVRLRAFLTASSDSSSPQTSIADAGLDINALSAGDSEYSYSIQTDAMHVARGSQVNLTLNVLPYHVIYVNEYISEFVNSGDYNGGNYGHFASAFADPYFYIDPSFVNASKYNIVLSNGIANSPVSGIPEPSTWGMMLLGFAGLGFASYRRTKKSVAAHTAA